MIPLLYGELVPWYRLLDPPAEHADEARTYREALERAVPDAETLLELGSGGGHNALHLAPRFRCTLSDISEPMLGLSRELVPQCEHQLGDMRTIRIGRTFDTVLVHDAIMYMTTERDLRAAVTTAFVHTRPGGAAAFAPDALRETFQDSTELIEGDAGALSLRCIEWSWDPSPDDCTFITDYALLLRDQAGVRAVHDRHVEGLFPESTWRRVLTEAGFEVDTFGRPRDDQGNLDPCFICKRPA
jgi:SAM-dependent methyltransferase